MITYLSGVVLTMHAASSLVSAAVHRQRGEIRPAEAAVMSANWPYSLCTLFRECVH